MNNKINMTFLGFHYQRFYLVGSDRNKQLFRVLKIDRSEPSDLNISEDPVVYSPKEIKKLLKLQVFSTPKAPQELIYIIIFSFSTLDCALVSSAVQQITP